MLLPGWSLNGYLHIIGVFFFCASAHAVTPSPSTRTTSPTSVYSSSPVPQRAQASSRMGYSTGPTPEEDHTTYTGTSTPQGVNNGYSGTPSGREDASGAQYHQQW